MSTFNKMSDEPMYKNTLVILIGLLVSITHAVSPEAIDQYNVIWDHPSKDVSESMPVGGHSIGLNLWVENGDILFYAQRSGCFTENNEYHKLGRVRVTLDPNPFLDGESFRQELKLREGYVEIQGQKGALEATVRVWAEAFRPVVHVDIDCSQNVTVKVAYEGWRNEMYELKLAHDGSRPRFGCFSWDSYPGQVWRYPDVIQHKNNSVLFYHRNREDKLLFDYMVKQQGLEFVRSQLINTQQGRTFGGLLTGDGFVPTGTDTGEYIGTSYKAWILRSEKPSRTHKLKLYTHVDQTETLEAWQRALSALVNEQISDDRARKRTQAWWEAFWNRSWLIIHPQEPNPESKAWQLGRNYQLFRYQLGCNTYGEYPSKFNGGNFTYDPRLVRAQETSSPDWRAWGGGSFTAQNQRLLYWPMLKTGDFEAMIPQFEFYRRALPNAEARVKTYWGHGGCLFTEQMENFGLPIACAWGWTEPGAKKRQRPPEIEHGVQVNPYVSYHYEAQLEFSYMILEYHRFSGADISHYLDFIKKSVLFFDEHYQMRFRKETGQALDDRGKLVIYPSTACETYRGAKNPSDLVAGLQACITALLTLPEIWVSVDEKTFYRDYLKRIPDLSFGEANGDRILKPAESWTSIRNVECPQFYPLFPFNRFELGVDDMTVFRNTWKHGTFRKDMVQSWHQDGIFFARMGMTEAAQDYNTKKMQDSPRRFPTFWGPGHDWVPDHNWGGSGMLGLQEMLMQCIGDTIRLFPAWPKDWDVDFKLHAPKRTIVEGSLKCGKIQKLTVTPKERKKDVFMQDFAAQAKNPNSHSKEVY